MSDLAPLKAMRLPAEGGCSCGAVRFRVSAQPILTAVCHCKGCQKLSASAFSLTIMVPQEGFAVTKGETVLGGNKRPEREHHHCPECHGWVFTRIPDRTPFVNVRPAMLDEPGDFVPFIETYTSVKLPWADTPARHKFEQFPPREDFAPLLAEYATLIASEEC